MIESDPELSTIAQELWDNDVNRLRPGADYRISLQVSVYRYVYYAENNTPIIPQTILLPFCTVAKS